jgi:1-acyl-sn-glycerol-3-phosphate acyltransferase
MSSSQTPSPDHKLSSDFLPAKPSAWLLWLAQSLLRLDLPLSNSVQLAEQDLNVLRSLPAGAGIILTPNHADEKDPPICMDLARRCGRRFLFMGNREAFTEGFGAAGWALQRIGVFSVKRGGRDAAAKQYAINVVRGAQDVLVIFPEGEILYLNDTVQPFHSGAVEIAMKAILEERKNKPDFTAYIVPMAIKYRYQDQIKEVLERRVSLMERKLSKDMSGHELHKRLKLIVAELLKRQESAHNIECEVEEQRLTQLGTRVKNVRHSIISEIEQKYPSAYNDQSMTLDRAFQLSAHVREAMLQEVDPEHQMQYRQDLSALKEVEHLVSWRPSYIDGNASVDRMAEVVLKLERELYGIKRPRQLAKREVYLRIGEPINLGNLISDYIQDPHQLREHVSEQLRSTIQSLIDQISVSTAVTEPQEESTDQTAG